RGGLPPFPTRRSSDLVVIGSDQVADLDGTPVGKPGTHERAVEQLRAMSGRSVVFQTAVAVVRHDRSHAGAALVPVTVRFRRLDRSEEHTSELQSLAYL